MAVTPEPGVEILIAVGALEFCVRVDGDDDGVPLVLVNGLGSQLTYFPQGLVDSFVDRGFRVVRLDNRDVGRTTHLDDRPVDPAAVLDALRNGEPVDVPYRLSDMAADVIGVLDALGIDAAHVFGVSMGGMVVQTLAIEHPDRILTMTSVMSTTGEAAYGTPTDEAIAQLLSPAPTTEDEAVARDVASAKVWGSPDWIDEAAIERQARLDWRRDADRAGRDRQLAAVYASGHRAQALPRLDLPVSVVHGSADTLVTPSGGERTASLIPGAELFLVDGMGHDYPPPVWPNLVEAVLSAVRRTFA